MATASFDPGGRPRRESPPPLDRVAGDMVAIFGAPRGGRPASVDPETRLLVPAERPAGRSPWRKGAAVLLGGGAAGALLGWWVLAVPSIAERHAALQAPAHVATAAPVTPAAPPEQLAIATQPLVSAPPPAETIAPAAGDDVAVAPPPADTFTVEAPPRPERPDAVPAPPSFAARDRRDEDCARFADACTFADMRDADFQLRQAYAEAVDAGADPRELDAVRRRWARFRARDADRPDLLVTDYARLAGRLGWLADNAAGRDDDFE